MAARGAYGPSQLWFRSSTYSVNLTISLRLLLGALSLATHVTHYESHSLSHQAPKKCL